MTVGHFGEDIHIVGGVDQIGHYQVVVHYSGFAAGEEIMAVLSRVAIIVEI